MYWFAPVRHWVRAQSTLLQAQPGGRQARALRSYERRGSYAFAKSLLAFLCIGMALFAASGCKDSSKDRPGKLFISTQTDMSVPGGIDTIELRVEIGGEVRHEKTFEVAPVGKQKIPFVYELEAADEPPGEVTVTVIGLLNDDPQVFAQTVTTFPEDDRAAFIELPLQWLCTGQVTENKDGTFESSCEPIKDNPAACVAGECRIAVVKETELPDYTPQNVFGGASKPGANGTCFPTETCFDEPFIVVPNADCQVQVVAQEQQLNLALQLPQDAESPLSGPGICSPSGCFVPLDNDAQTGYTFLAGPGFGDAGTEANLVQVGLPKAVCEKLDAGELTAVVASQVCPTKTSRTPTCGEWSSTARVLEVVLQSNLPGDAASDATTNPGEGDAGPIQELIIVVQGGRDGGKFVVGDEIQLTLQGTESDEVIWASSDESIATVDEDGVVKVVGVGVVIITATVDGQTVEFEIVAEAPGEIGVVGLDDLTFVMLNPSEAMIPAGASVDIEARGTFQNGSTIVITDKAQWSSDDEAVATVEGGHVVGIQPGVVTIRAEASDIVAEARILVTDALLTLLTVEPADLTLPVGVSQSLVATATYSNGQSLVASTQAQWNSGDSEVAEVDAKGTVTAVGIGETVITAELDGKTDTVFVKVTDATLQSLTVEPNELALYVGQRGALLASASFSDGQSVDVSSQVTWKSDDEQVATVAFDPQSGLRVTGVAEGNTTVTGTFGDAEVSVPTTVTAVPLTSLVLSPSNVSLPKGATTALALVANFADGKSFDATDDAAWSTGNHEVATILANGTVVAQGVGTVEITAKLANLEASTIVRVTDAKLLGVSLNPARVTLTAGLSAQLTATASYSDGRSMPVTTQADWSSSDTSVVVNDEGVVRGISPGTSTVRVTLGGFSATSRVSVADAELESIRIEADETSVPAGQSLALRAAATYTDGNTIDVTRNVTWRSDDNAVGVVGATGTFTGRSPGEAVVSATLGPISANLSLEVTSALPVSIVLSPNPVSLARGTTRTLSARVEYSDGTSRAPGAGAEWSSANQTIATVNNGVVTGAGEGTTDIVLRFAGIEGRASVTVTQATPTQLTVTASPTTVAAGQAVTLSALVTYSDGTSSDVTEGVTWRSTTPAIATVGANSGVALAVAPGTAIVEGTFGALVSTATFAVMEATVATLEITPATASVAQGNTAQFTARATYTDGITITVTTDARWSSDTTGVATVGNSTGRARGEAPGTANITATYGGQSASARLTVTNAALTGLRVLPNEASVAAGNTQRFVAEAEYSDGTSVAVTPTWSTSNANFATVNAQGEARGRAPGTANIVANFGGRQAQASLTVTNAVVVRLAIAPSNPTIPSGTTRQFTATATYSNGTTGTIAATFSSSNTTRLQINSTTGLARGGEPGNATVTASAQGLSVSTTAQVTAGTLASISVTPDERSVPAGSTLALAATATYTDGRTIGITSAAAWRTSDSAVATVQAGVVTARAPGEVTITAEYDGETADVTVFVTSAVVTRLAVELVSGTSTQAPLGQTIALRARATYSDGTSPLVNPTWSVTSTTTPLPFTVNDSGVARATSVGQATVTASFSGVTGSIQLTATDAVVVGLVIDPASANLVVGTTRQLAANATYSDGTTRNVSSTATWTTSDGNTARVTAGLAEGVAAGEATIRATFGGAAATSTVNVSEASVVSVAVTSPAGNTVAAGLTRTLVATATYDNGSTEVVTSQATWSTSAIAILTVDSGVVTGVTTGQATLSASFEGVSGTLAMTVTAAQLSGLRMEPSSLNLPSGRDAAVRLVGLYTNGSEQNLTSAATWSSSEGEVASYDAGRVYANAPGNATITASTGGRSATLNVSVTDAVVESITVTPNEGSVPAGNTLQLVAEANYSDGHSEVITTQAAWTSGSPTVASVTANGGLVRGVAAGSQATIRAVFGGQTGTALIAVTNAVVSRVVVSPAQVSIPNGTTRQLAARAVYSDGTEAVVTNTATWTRASGESASVNATGLVRGVAVGNSVIRATFNGVAGNSTITVTDGVPNGLTLTPTEANVIVGTTLTLTARESYTDGRVITDGVNARATWTSSDGRRASVEGGVVRGLVADQAPITITATLGEFSASATVVVVAATISRISVNVAESSSVPVGLTRQLTATATYNNGTSRDVTTEAQWASSDSTVLLVSPPGNSASALATGRAVGTANATATVGQVVGVAALQVTNAVVQDVRVAPTTLGLIDGQSGSVQLFAIMSGGTEQNVTTASTTTWQSENADIASVASGGVVSAQGAGRVRIYGNYQGFRASCDVTVTEARIASLSITLGSTSIPAGTTTSVRVDALWNNGTITNATSSAEWTTSNANIATVADGSAVVRAGRQTGRVELEATVGGVSATVALTVTAPTLTSLDVTPATNSLVEGTSVQLQAVATYSDGSSITVTGEEDTTWTTSNANVASMGRIKGSFMANSPGTASITARFGGVSDTATITVTAAQIVELWIEPVEFTLDAGKELPLTAFGQMSNGLVQDVSGLVKWATSNPYILSVNDTGLVTAMLYGDAEITATASNDLSATAYGYVPDSRPLYTNLKVCSSSLSIAVGGTYGLAVMGESEEYNYEDISNLMTWTSSDETLSVDAMGTLNALKEFKEAEVKAEYMKESVSAQIFAFEASTYLEASPAVVRLTTGGSAQIRIFLVESGRRTDITSNMQWSVDNQDQASVSRDGDGGLLVRGNWPPGCTFVRFSYQDMQLDVPITVSGPLFG